jgi:hypothetical protein
MSSTSDHGDAQCTMGELCTIYRRFHISARKVKVIREPQVINVVITRGGGYVSLLALRDSLGGGTGCILGCGSRGEVL